MSKLQSIQLGQYALYGDDDADRTTIDEKPYNYKNTLTMRSNVDRVNEWIDLPSLTSFSGNGNFYAIGSVTLESTHLAIDKPRYP